MGVNGKPRLVICDWDGTITRFLPRLTEHQKRAARRCGLPVSPIVRQEAYERNGGRPYASFDEAVAGFWPNASRMRIRAFALAFCLEELVGAYPAVQGAVRALSALRAQGIALALCTSRDPVTLGVHLAFAGMRPWWFKAIVTGVSRYRKPDPRALRPIFRKVRVEPEHALLVGDTPSDGETARRAGVPFVGVLTGLTSREGFKKYGVPEERIARTLPEALHRFCG